MGHDRSDNEAAGGGQAGLEEPIRQPAGATAASWLHDGSRQAEKAFLTIVYRIFIQSCPRIIPASHPTKGDPHQANEPDLPRISGQITGRAANTGVDGLIPLPIFDAAFGVAGYAPGGTSQSSQFTNANYIALLQQGQAGALANQLATNATFLCNMVGSTFSPCAR